MRGERIEEYDRIISTVPLPELVAVRRSSCIDAGSWPALRWVSVYNVNLAVAREHVSDKHCLFFRSTGTHFTVPGSHEFFSVHGAARGSSLYVGDFTPATWRRNQETSLI